MSIFDKLFGLLKTLLPFLMSAAERAFKKLPQEQQDQIISISKLVEVVKQTKGKSIGEAGAAILKYTGLGLDRAEDYLIQYLKDKGVSVTSFKEAVTYIWSDAETRTETGLKSLYSGMGNIISSFVANVDWQALLLGLGEYAYRTFVKGKIKI